ncbi:mushroom body large-type Kenyon cell-specific protein 1-like isoform X2 [Macrosteles quadrilineatus]|uniref:mushroom body large-type Kenyon cell-specific protein 1-like isoform X2 n=1 Tax=Macrosteles quadrilineatus TaxID=74068 RepID=UPI0023E2D4D1|nr:mushroom body large-type Kenyon cell-specific protein 1-like isoform X2 [Macrosteles quadrilineatus]
MAECSYARCVLERRTIRKSLQSWTKTMVQIVGLERVAEELMGRRKWRQLQKLVSSELACVESPMETQDWEPSDKCNLCLQPGHPDTLTHVPRPASAGSVSSSVTEDSSPTPAPAMTTLESVANSMAASLAAVAALSQGKPPAALYPPFPWYLGPEPPKPGTSEQPLDLSKSSVSKSPPPAAPAEPSPDTPPSLQRLVPSPSLKVPAAINRLYKAKPRLSAVAGRRTYTEDELQAALRDIQSGKLGTRRAAVIYGIPRSTLRNKVYKLAMERERDSHLVSPEQVAAKARALLGDKDDDDQEDDDDKDSGAEEEREVEKALMRPIISIEDFIRLSSESGGFPGTDSLRTLLQHGNKTFSDKKEDGSSSPPVYPMYPPPLSSELLNGLDHSALGPYINRLLGANPLGTVNPFTMGSRNSPPQRSPTESQNDLKMSHLELVRRMMLEERLIQEEQQKKDRSFMNGSRLGEPGPSSSIAQDDETSGSGTPPNVILRIPSFKPVPKNSPGDHSMFPLGVKIGESSQHSVISPPISAGRSESSSPTSIGKGISVSLKDVIAKSISQKFQQPTDLHHLPHTPHGLDHYRRADFSQALGCSSPIMRNHNNNHVDDRKLHHTPTSKPPTSGTNSGTTSGGKGTRPKRGKYRNYDRDSLVEAVRAVQRGEMSVHRAGSYYGVPHSTLEYKVKERHLMRPRKREPKSVQEEIKLKEDPIAARISPAINASDKCKLLPTSKPLKTPFTPQTPLPTAPNGLKMPPIFDPSLPYSATPPFPFWAPNPFPHIPMEYPRNPSFQPTPDHFFASQMIQRLQEDSARTPLSPPPTLGKTARELAETLYDGTGANGSFLDGIIRSSLESGLSAKVKEGEMKRPEDMSNKALLDQLCRNSRMAPLPKAEPSSSDEETTKRANNQKRPSEDSSPVPQDSVKVEVKDQEPEDLDPTLRAEVKKESDINTEDSNIKTDNADESACDSNHTIKRVKLEGET